MRFFRQSLIVFISTALSFLISYLYHFVIARLLGPSDYGLFGVGMQFLWVLYLPLIAISTSVTKYTADLLAKKEPGKVKYMILSFLKVQFILGISIMIFVLIFNDFISQLFGGDMNAVIIAFSFSIPFSFLFVVIKPYVQGIKKVYLFSASNIIEPLSKFIAGVSFVLIGWGVFGASFATFFAPLTVLIFFFPIIYKNFKVKSKKFSRKSLLKFSFPILLTNIFVSLMITFDLFFVKIFLGAESAGYYSSAATLGKAMFMSFGAVLVVFFPELVESHALKDKKQVFSKLKYALFYTSLIIVPALFAYVFFPELIISILYSEVYLPAVPALQVLAFGTFSYSFFMVLLHALWAMDDYKPVLVFSALLFVIDIILLPILVPVLGIIGAALTTSVLMGVLLIFTSVLLIRKYLQ